MSAETLAGIAARTGASQILIILDTCYSGTETISATVVADLVIKERPPDASRVWVGVLASALAYEKARDGIFGARLRKLLRDGPSSPEQQLRWSSHSVGVRGDDVCDALVKEWDTREQQQPTWTSNGDPGVMFPNPRYDPRAPEKIVEHLSLAARGVEPGGEGFYFSGRIPELDRVVGWMATGTPGVFVITGPTGCGKSAILGRLVSLSNPEQRSRILAGGLAHADPGEGSVAAYVHARGLDADQLVGSLDDQLVGKGILAPGPAGRRNRGELQGALEGSGTCPVIAVDGLNELGADSWKIAEQVLRVLGGVARVIVTTRELRPSDDRPSLIDTLLPDQILDLGAADYAEETDKAISEYVARRLAGVDVAHMDPAKVANAILALSQPQRDGAFLLARILTTQLRDEPIDTSGVRWQDALSDSAEAAFDRDVGRIPALAKGDKLVPEAARELLAALSWAYGSGMPDDVWSIAATALSPAQTGYDRGDVYWLLGQVGRYIVEDGEGGQAVYRLSHQLFAEDLRRSAAGPSQTAEQHSAALAASLGNYYQRLLEAGRRADEPTYLWRYTWRHCADGGDAGIAVLRTLADMDRAAFLPDLAAASDALASRRARSGQLMAAVAPAEEAVTRYRELAAADPAFTPNLAMALDNLGVRYSGVGRRAEAVAPAEEAVTRYRELAAADPAFTPNLAMALNNLGVRYSGVGRRAEAVAPAEEALTRYRELAAANPAFTPNLAGALNNLGIRYSEVGRRAEAVAPAEEALTRYRELAAANPAFTPDLAMALNNLGNRYSGVGRRAEAVAPAEEAVTRYRELAAADPAFTPDLAMALDNLGVRYSGVGRLGEAVAPAEEAVTRYRELAAANPAFTPDLARTLDNLGVRYSEVGRRAEAVAPAEEAVTRYRELAAANPAFTPDLAMALNNLGNRYSEVGRRAEAVAPAEEAVTRYRELAAANPAFTPDLAMALDNLGVHYSGVGRRAEAVAPAEEAVTRYRELAAANLAFTPNLAGALDNLGNRYSEVGRRAEAVAPAEEAVTRYRELAAANLAFTPDLARALNNLGVRYSEVGRRAEAVAPAEEAVTRYRELAAANPAFTPNLARALDNLGVRYSEVGRRAEAVAPAEEAVTRYRELAAANPAFTPELPGALNNLGNRYSEAEREDETDRIWHEVLHEFQSQPDREVPLLLARASSRPPPDLSQAIDDVLAGLSAAGNDGSLQFQCRDLLRSLRARSPADFDAAWAAADQAQPAWLLLDQATVDLIYAWLATPTWRASLEFARNHLDALLAPLARLALDEIALLGDEALIADHREILDATSENGVDAAYEPFILPEIIGEWMATSDWASSQQLFDANRGQLCGDRSLTLLTDQAADYPDALRYLAIVQAARSGEDPYRLIGNPDGIRHALQKARGEGDCKRLEAIGLLGATTLDENNDRATALFHLAIGQALDADRTVDTAISAAAKLAPGKVTSWLRLLVELAAHHPDRSGQLAQLATALTPASQE